MEIRGTGNVGGSEPIRPHPLNSNRFKIPEETKLDRVDRVEISDLARFKALLKEVPEVRLDRIEEIRAQIDAGIYETPDRIAITVDKILEELGDA
ncbi:MAG: flagellar biosynthesis anti-sigma factor FlgM [Planctomycetes bacterium]|nr:flagellar biosynthesis anti-sigma factor FlgM [Planctomycetota bacterium]